jgi:hypothetical protein
MVDYLRAGLAAAKREAGSGNQSAESGKQELRLPRYGWDRAERYRSTQQMIGR